MFNKWFYPYTTIIKFTLSHWPPQNIKIPQTKYMFIIYQRYGHLTCELNNQVKSHVVAQSIISLSWEWTLLWARVHSWGGRTLSERQEQLPKEKIGHWGVRARCPLEQQQLQDNNKGGQQSEGDGTGVWERKKAAEAGRNTHTHTHAQSLSENGKTAWGADRTGCGKEGSKGEGAGKLRYCLKSPASRRFGCRFHSGETAWMLPEKKGERTGRDKSRHTLCQGQLVPKNKA